MQKRIYAVAGPFFVLASADTALALEYCVTCEGPPAIYRCVIEGTGDGPGNDPRASLHCISEMAKQGGHQSCSVSRGAPFPCPGLTASVNQPKARMDHTPPASEVAGSPPPLPPTHDDDVEPSHNTATKPSSKVPSTVEELAGETVRSSKQGLKKAGEAIGGTAKMAGEQIGNAGTALGSAAGKTWTCISSLFSRCGSDGEPEPAADEPGHVPED